MSGLMNDPLWLKNNLSEVYGVVNARPTDALYGDRGRDWQKNLDANQLLTESYNGLQSWANINSATTYHIVTPLQDLSYDKNSDVIFTDFNTAKQNYTNYTDKILDNSPATYYVAVTHVAQEGRAGYLNSILDEYYGEHTDYYKQIFFESNSAVEGSPLYGMTFEQWAKEGFKTYPGKEYTLFKEVDEQFLNEYYGVQPEEEEILPEGTFYVNGILYEPGFTHTVSTGEHLADIAREYGFSIEDIKAANPDYDFGKNGTTIYDVDGRNKLRIPQLYVPEEHQTFYDINGNPYKINFPGYLDRTEYSLYAKIMEPLCYANDGKVPPSPSKNYTTAQNMLILRAHESLDDFSLTGVQGSNDCSIRFSQTSEDDFYTQEELAKVLGCDIDSIKINSFPFYDGTTHYNYTIIGSTEPAVDMNSYSYRYPAGEIIVPDYVTFGARNPQEAALASDRFTKQVLILSYLNGGQAPTKIYQTNDEFNEAVSKIQNSEILECIDDLGGINYEIANTYSGLYSGQLAVGTNNDGVLSYRFTPNQENTDYMQYLQLLGFNTSVISENPALYDKKYQYTNNFHLGAIGKLFGWCKLEPFAQREDALFEIPCSLGTDNMAGIGIWHDEEYYAWINDPKHRFYN